MTKEERLTTAIESMDMLSTRLRELSNLINTVHLGLMEEDAEKQVLDCIMCFLHFVNDIHEHTRQTVKELCAEEDNQTNT